jgi:ABC-2 type transport system permease protein
MTHPLFVFLRLELSDALRSKWMLFASSVYLALGGAFVWLGLRESSVLGFTGLSRVMLNMANAVIVVFPLIVLIGTHAAVIRGRSTGFCELMLTQPVRRSTWLFALLASRLLILLGPLLVLLLVSSIAALSGESEPEFWLVAARSLSICAALVFAFIGAGLWISSAASTTERALVWALILFVATSALQDVLLITTLLRTSLPPQVVFGLAVLNPSEAARVGILTSVDPELSVLGPVGFWLANTLGPLRTMQLAVAWPLTIGVVCFALALVRLRRIDLVA